MEGALRLHMLWHSFHINAILAILHIDKSSGSKLQGSSLLNSKGFAASVASTHIMQLGESG
jgi:hypothetical protein